MDVHYMKLSINNSIHSFSNVLFDMFMDMSALRNQASKIPAGKNKVDSHVWLLPKGN